jgi:hypothetical protein
MCVSAWAHGAEPADTGQGFGKLPLQRVNLGNCAFELPMRKDFSLRLTQRSTPRLAHLYAKLIPGKTEFIDEETSIGFECVEASNLETLSYYCIKHADGHWASTEDCNKTGYERAFGFNGRNWIGLGVVDTTTAVPEGQRARNLAFCLIREPVALCLTADTLQYEMHPQDNALPYVLDYVRHIAFVNEAASASRSTPASAAGK